jgi:hypothetical protein
MSLGEEEEEGKNEGRGKEDEVSRVGKGLCRGAL